MRTASDCELDNYHCGLWFKTQSTGCWIRMISLSVSDMQRLDLVEELPCSYEKQVIIMPAADGLFGFAGVDRFRLYLWSRVATIDWVVSWTRPRVIALDTFFGLEVVALCSHALPVGHVEYIYEIFIEVYPIIYMIHLKTMSKFELSNKGIYGPFILTQVSRYCHCFWCCIVHFILPNGCLDELLLYYVQFLSCF